MSDKQAQAHMEAQARLAIEPAARAVAHALEQPAEVDINEIILRPTAQAA